MLTCAESAEAERPCNEDGERSEEELVARSSAHRRLSDRRLSDVGQPRETSDRLLHIASYAGRLPAIVGHQLANGLCAPLLI